MISLHLDFCSAYQYSRHNSILRRNQPHGAKSVIWTTLAQPLTRAEIVYFVAAVVVLFNAEEHSQRHYLGHTEDIKW